MLDLLDWRRTVFDMYRYVRKYGDDPATVGWFQTQRDELFQMHPQSPLNDEQKSNFRGLPYYPYRKGFRVMASVDHVVEPGEIEIDSGEDGIVRLRRFGRAHFDLPTGSGALSLFWVMGYGGGVFLPFRDTSNETDTYGGGRYLYDTIKGADLGTTLDTITLDFNYAYNPSCAYNSRWVCPLAPAENHLEIAIPVGELRFDG
jgi:hypothetical protein